MSKGAKKKHAGDLKGKEVLDIRMRKDNDANADTVRDYFKLLLEELWAEGEGFSGKRPFGNSGWEYDLYYALADAKAIDVVVDEDGSIEDFKNDYDKANRLIYRAIDAL